MGKAFFESANPLGKRSSIPLKGKYRDFVVSGIVDRIPGNSSLQFDCILLYQNVFDAFEVDPSHNDFVTLPTFTTAFLELPDNKTAESLKRKLPDFHDKIYDSMWRQVNTAPQNRASVF